MSKFCLPSDFVHFIQLCWHSLLKTALPSNNTFFKFSTFALPLQHILVPVRSDNRDTLPQRIESLLKSRSGHKSTVTRIENEMQEILAKDVTLLTSEISTTKYFIEKINNQQQTSQRMKIFRKN